MARKMDADFPGGAGSGTEPHQAEGAGYRHAGAHIAVDHHNDHADHSRQQGQSDHKAAGIAGMVLVEGSQDQADAQGNAQAGEKLPPG